MGLHSPRVSGTLIVIAFAMLVSCRLPSVILEGGRFWAEEGVIYFHAAWYLPWYEALIFIHTGYINFAAAFATWVGMHLGGITHAPAVTVAFALAIQCLPVYVIVTHDFPWRRSVFLTVLAALICALPPLTSEVWLNTITSQFHLGLCGALIFASPSIIPGLFYADCAILLLGSLSGPVTCFLFPLFALAALVTRNRQAIIHATILCIGFAVQVAVFMVYGKVPRGGRLNLDGLLSVISLHTIVLQFSGSNAADKFAGYLSASYAAHQFLSAGVAIFLLFYSILALAIFKARYISLAKLLAACIVISLISFYESLGGDFVSFMTLEFGERYSFVPMAINGLIIVGLASADNRLMKGVFSLLLGFVITVGAADYRQDLPLFNNGPPWLPQLTRWHVNSNIALYVWPNKSWPTALAADHIPRKWHPEFN